MLTFVFNFSAIILIILIISWFWLIRAKSTEIQKNKIKIYVRNGVYDPGRIETHESNLELEFIREDASPCSEYVLFDRLDIHEQLPLKQSHIIRLTNLVPGSYRFTCQMGMYQGELVVK